jgi:[ribosomal protein S5]-alanine N-acetyltransferase
MSFESAFTEFPTLRTQRLVLRQISPADAPAIFKIFSNPEVVRFGGTPLFTSLAEAEFYTQRVQEGYELRQNLRWGVTLQGEDVVIGTCTFHHFGPGFHCVETGYNLHRAYWGRGIITEAMRAVLAYGFTDLNCHRIEAVIDETNLRSISLITKLGFTFEGTLRQRFPIRGRFEDESYYSMLKPEWVAQQSPL